MGWILSNKRISVIILLSVLVLSLCVRIWFMQKEINKAEKKCNDEKSELILSQLKDISKQIEKNKPIEAKFESDKEKLNEKTIETIKHTTTIFKEPYYIDRECFDSNFISLYNNYINTDSREHETTLPEPN